MFVPRLLRFLQLPDHSFRCPPSFLRLLHLNPHISSSTDGVPSPIAPQDLLNRRKKENSDFSAHFRTPISTLL
ncbi:unnamed protein product [Linum trigynum]|uniref:Uncharacterized protein n=1 Tax=Linum trigynum TaxID=586398 RepID=A0AAV2G8L8_9ROSI